MTKILVYRFSAMGDVILLLPVIKGLLDSDCNIEVYLVTQKGFFPVFANVERLHLVEVDLKGKHKGFSGLFRLFNFIRKDISPDLVFDLHRVLRTFALNFLFSLSGFPVVRFTKGTFRKNKIIKRKSLNPWLPGTIERYTEAFTRKGYMINLPKPPFFSAPDSSLSNNTLLHQSTIIGIAPFAKHKQKIWGIHKVQELIVELNKSDDLQIVLFGGGASELKILDNLAQRNRNCIVAARYFNFSDEVILMSRLSLMLSMDSANMHLAAMAGVPTISIWGATHPALGFAPYRQPVENIIQYEGDQLQCRPCSVYGNRECIYSDGIRCMDLIPVSSVLTRINEILHINSTQSAN